MNRWTRLLALACMLAPSMALAQKGSAMIYGAVVNKATQGTITGAVIRHAGDGREVRSDSLGYYQFHELKPGIVRFTVTAPGFPTGVFAVALINDERMERDIEIDSLSSATAQAPVEPPGSRKAQALAEVTVSAEASMGRRYADFERRKATGRGQYLTRGQIDSSGANNLQEAVRGLRGVNLHCSGTQCYIQMARAPMRCLPEYVVDERVDNWFGPTIPIRDIEALEVYSGPGDVPGEFGGSNAGCGVIVIWTRSGPGRKKP